MKTILLTIMFMFFAQISLGQFVTTWETTGSNRSIRIPTNSDFTYNYTVDWGDGTFSSNQTGDATHTYQSQGVYMVSISGTFPAIYFNSIERNIDPIDPFSRMTIKSVAQWGDNSWQSMKRAFSGCANLIITATDAPDLNNVTDMGQMFYNATNINQDMNGWNVSNITNMGALFYGVSNFNQDISSWDVSNVTNMSFMFYQASNFNQNISGWDVGSVTNMSLMFGSAASFNQAIGGWNVSNVTNMSKMFATAIAFNQNIENWNVSNVIDMSEMFDNAPAFNQNIGNWNVSSVTNMYEMFKNATAFNQNISGWDVSNVTDMRNMLTNSGFSLTNYDNLLMGWASQTLQPDVFLGASGISYCNGESARLILTSAPNNWIINDNGKDCSSLPFISIPDANFEQALINQNIDSDGIVNGQVLEADIINIEFLNISANNISDLTGIEGFLALETLLASGNNLNSIDISSNSNLSGLYVGMNALESIDVSNNTNLVALVLSSNQLSSIDVSNNILLTQLFLQDNQLTSIDVSGLEDLVEINLSENNLNELDLSQNLLLTQIYCSNNDLFNLNVQNGNNTAVDDSDFNASLNENLTCIQVDDLAYSNANWNTIDSQSIFSLECAPDNDDCLDAVSLSLGSLVNGSTFGSTSSNTFPSCQEDTIVLLDVWYQFTAPSSGAITALAASTLNNLNINMAIYEDCNDVEPISCDSGTIAVTDLVPGQTYFIQIWVGGNLSRLTSVSLADEFTLNVQDTSLLSNNSFELRESDVQLAPNPASNQTIIISRNVPLNSIQIFDITGKSIESINQINRKNQTINTSEFAAGMYLLQVSSNTSTITKKLVIK